MKSLFQDFTNQYALSKTLRFELRPIGNTQQMLVDNDVVAEDGIRKEKYEKVKRYFDRLHREFVQEALQDITLDDLDEYLDIFRKWQQDKKNKQFFEALQKKEKSLRKDIVEKFDAHAKQWADGEYAHLHLKKKSMDLFFEEEVFSLLSDRYGAEDDAHLLNPESGEVLTLFDDWKGFTGYFKKFHETRKNFYTDDGKSTALATRIIDQNLRRFCDNVVLFEKLEGKIDFAEIEGNCRETMGNVFSMDFYNQCILQAGIDFYNTVLGGETLASGEKKKGINELVNKYRQDHKEGEKLPFLKTLDKQILSEKERMIFGIENDEQCFEALSVFHQNAVEKVTLLKNLLSSFCSKNETFDTQKVYLSREAVNTIMYRWMDDVNAFQKSLFDVFKAEKDKSAKYEKADDSYSFPDFISIGRVKKALEMSADPLTFWKARYYKSSDDTESRGILSGNELVWEQFLFILEQEFGSLFKNTVKDKETGEKYDVGYDISLPQLEQFLSSGTRKINKETKVVIKNYADDILRIYQMGKYFSLEKKRAWNTEYKLDSLFYSHPETGYMQFHANAYEMIVQKYNDLRNYLTKKSYSEKKWKLNFENPTLANGWDKNKEADNSAVILRTDGKYYLGLMKKGNAHLFGKRNTEQLSEDMNHGYFEKMVYKLFPDPSKMMPKVCFSQKGLDFFVPTSEVMSIYEGGSFKKGEHFSLKNMQRLISFYKECLVSYPGWQCYDFSQVKEANEYANNIGDFYADVARAGYKISFEKVSQSYIEKKNQDGELYLFEIYNQDFADGKKGKKNLHTMYWEGLFSAENMNGFPLKLNGEAEIFYRPATLAEKLGERKDAKGISRVAHTRYAENKIFFHCPITLNRGKGEAQYFNQSINDFLASNSDINIIGVDRGEKHLAYYSVINQQGEIIDSGSLNAMNGVDYGEKLESKALEREQARRDWQSVEGIKDLKKGYISQVVRELADLAIEHNAIIVLEDLNMRFKQIRGGIEKSIYQKLEKALIDKLSFLVDKGEMNPEKAGHLLRAYQLAAPFKSFKEMGKQTGIIFYTQASYTSKIDPLTGWRPNLYLKYSNAQRTQEEIKNFSSILYNVGKNRFEFTYDLKRFQELKEYPVNTVWTVCSCVERFRWNKTLNENKGGYDHYVDMTEKMKAMFEKYHIDITGGIKEQIEALAVTGNEKFFKDFIFFWNLICQIRNTDPSKEKSDPLGDFILSPVEPFFDSRRAKDFGENLPKNGDDNGAYNIARKGIMILDKISDFKERTASCKDLKWGDLSISQSDWDTFAQRKRS